MERKWIWLLLFAGISGAALYLWYSGGAAPPSVPQADESPVEHVESFGEDEVHVPAPKTKPSPGPVAPADRPAGRFELAPPVFPQGNVPPPGFVSPPPIPFDGSGPSGDMPPGSANSPSPSFEPMPPQAFENPDFVTPPPPPPQFDSDAVPFEDEPPLNPQAVEPPSEDFNPPPSSEDF